MKILASLLLAGLLGTTGCVGPNNAFDSVSTWNSKATDSKWTNELIHIGLWIVPVYEFALLSDLLVFNSFEFWGAENPISEPDDFENQGDL